MKNNNELNKIHLEEVLRDLGTIFKDLNLYPSARGKLARTVMFVMGTGPGPKTHNAEGASVALAQALPEIKGFFPEIEFNIPESKRNVIIEQLKEMGYMVKRPLARIDNKIVPHPYRLRLTHDSWREADGEYIENICISLIPVDFVEELDYSDAFREANIDYAKLSSNPDLLDVFGIEKYQKDIIRMVQPQTMKEWVYVYGFMHNAYVEGHKDIVDEMLSGSPLVFREDLCEYSSHVFKNKDDAFGFSEKIRKGLVNRIMEEELDYVCSKEEFPYTKEQLKKVRYLNPKEHAITYCTQYFLILAKLHPELVPEGGAIA